MNDFYEKLDAMYKSGALSSVEGFITGAINDYSNTENYDFITGAGLFNELACYYRGVGEFGNSFSAFSQALAIFEDNGLRHLSEYTTVLLNLAGLYRLTGENEDAAGVFLRVLGLYEKAGKKDTFDYISVLNSLSLLYQEKSDFTKALEYAEHAHKIISSKETSEQETAASFNNLAAIKLRLGDVSCSQKYIDEALKIYSALPNPDAYLSSALITKSVINCRLEQYIEALEGFRKASYLTKRFFGENIEFAACLRNIAEVHLLMGNTREAIKELGDAARISTRILGPGHPTVMELNKNIAELNIVD